MMIHQLNLKMKKKKKTKIFYREGVREGTLHLLLCFKLL